MTMHRLSDETYAALNELVGLGKRAVLKAQADSRRRGVPNVYAIHGRLYYETSTGELSLVDPYPPADQPSKE